MCVVKYYELRMQIVWVEFFYGLTMHISCRGRQLLLSQLSGSAPNIVLLDSFGWWCSTISNNKAPRIKKYKAPNCVTETPIK